MSISIDRIVKLDVAVASGLFAGSFGTGSHCVPLRIATPGAVEYPEPGSSTMTPLGRMTPFTIPSNASPAAIDAMWPVAWSPFGLSGRSKATVGIV